MKIDAVLTEKEAKHLMKALFASAPPQSTNEHKVFVQKIVDKLTGKSK